MFFNFEGLGMINLLHEHNFQLFFYFGDTARFDYKASK